MDKTPFILMIVLGIVLLITPLEYFEKYRKLHMDYHKKQGWIIKLLDPHIDKPISRYTLVLLRIVGVASVVFGIIGIL